MFKIKLIEHVDIVAFTKYDKLIGAINDEIKTQTTSTWNYTTLTDADVPALPPPLALSIEDDITVVLS